MIINCLTDKICMIKPNFYDSISSAMLVNYFDIKSNDDILSWKIKRNYINATYTIVFPDYITLKDINYNLDDCPGLMGEDGYVIETSLDYINWTELPLKKDNSGFIYKYIKTGASGEKYYSEIGYDSTQLFFDASVLKNSLVYDLEMSGKNSKMFDYVFTKHNIYTDEMDYLYDNFIFKAIRFKFNTIIASPTSPFYFSELKILSDESLDSPLINKDILTIRSSMFYRQKLYELNTFLPDQIKTFMMMLETNNTDNYLEYESEPLMNATTYIQELTF